MDHSRRTRLLVVNTFLSITLVLTLLFVVVFVSLGSTSAAQGLVVIPIIILVFWLNAKHKFTAARIVVTYGFMITALVLALADRRTGTEYILIAIGCCSVIVFERLIAILTSFLSAFLCYVIYVWLDATTPFVPDPKTPYLLVQNSLMFLSGFVVTVQSLVFRSLVNKYSQSLKDANEEINTINDNLTASNEELQTFLENMDSLVRKKSAHLQAYMDAIDTTICAATLDIHGNFIMVNKPFASLSGYEPGDLLGVHYSVFDSGQFTPEFLSARDRSLLTGKSWIGELKYKRRNGSFFWIDCVVMPLKNGDGVITEFLSLGISITERKESDELKEQTQTLLETVAFKTSHKIRGPLASIDGLTHLVQNGLVSQHEFEMVVRKIAQSNDDLKEATSELVRFVNSHQRNFQANLRVP